jgi:hypothetical protein
VRPLAVEAFHLDDVSRRCCGITIGLRPRCILFQAGELKLKLLQDRAALRGLPELHVAQLRDRELQLLDLQRVGPCFVLRRGSARFGLFRAALRSSELLALRRDGSARLSKRGRERIGSAVHTGDVATPPPAMRIQSTT